MNRNPDGSKNKFRDPIATITHPGFLALQTHGKPVAYRNIRIRPLDEDDTLPTCPKCKAKLPEGWTCQKCGVTSGKKTGQGTKTE